LLPPYCACLSPEKTFTEFPAIAGTYLVVDLKNHFVLISVLIYENQELHFQNMLAACPRQENHGGDMNAIEIRIFLKESLNAAFRGETFEGSDIFRMWGKEFVAILENEYPKYRHVHRMIWNIAGSLLDRMVHPCQCSELIEEILYNPRAFLRTVLIIVKQLDLKNSVGPSVPPRLH
jgi:hypothetical protein